MFFGIDPAELVLIIVLAVIMFGPERIPQLSRKAARVVVALREIANNTQNQLREELGPEYSDLKLTDLNPKTLVRKHLSDEIAAIEETKAELMSAKDEVKLASTQMTSAATDAAKAISERQQTATVVRFDPEAT